MTSSRAEQLQQDLFRDLLTRLDDAKLARLVHEARVATKTYVWVKVEFEGVATQATVPRALGLTFALQECHTRGLLVAS